MDDKKTIYTVEISKRVTQKKDDGKVDYLENETVFKQTFDSLDVAALAQFLNAKKG